MKGAIGKQQEEEVVVLEGERRRRRSRRVSTTTESVSTTYTHIHSIAPAIQFTLLRMLNTYVFTTEYIPNYLITPHSQTALFLPLN